MSARRLLRHARRLFSTSTPARPAAVDTRASAAVYLHYPWCLAKCTYCAFNKYTPPSSGLPTDRFEQALVSDLVFSLTRPVEALQSGMHAAQLPVGQPLDAGSRPAALPRPLVHSVYFGGGTPSLGRPEMVSSVLDTIRLHADTAPDMEITLEANPTTLETDKLRAFKAAGINRLSLGVQALDDDDALRFLGRDHSAADANRAIEAGMSVFDRVSLDFIWGRPRQTVGSWTRELERIAALGVSHLSLYQLTVERGTPLYKAVKESQTAVLPDDDTMADLFLATQEVTGQHGYYQYEVSSFAKRSSVGSDAAVQSDAGRGRHNQSYWTGSDYIGVGPGAHGRLTSADRSQRYRAFRILEPAAWTEQCETLGHGSRRITPMTTSQVQEELIVLGLRSRSGIHASGFAQYAGNRSLHSMLEGKLDKLAMLQSHGLLDVAYDGDGYLVSVRPTQRGLGYADRISLELLV
ncbi:hypothetical protein BC831DRAFT_16599 [Entophlyctis helioformis]|nr:hypothetical protein BC831DRAFT_16599 [Entophlyctis helioformis]